MAKKSTPFPEVNADGSLKRVGGTPGRPMSGQLVYGSAAGAADRMARNRAYHDATGYPKPAWQSATPTGAHSGGGGMATYSVSKSSGFGGSTSTKRAKTSPTLKTVKVNLPGNTEADKETGVATYKPKGVSGVSSRQQGTSPTAPPKQSAGGSQQVQAQTPTTGVPGGAQGVGTPAQTNIQPGALSAAASGVGQGNAAVPIARWTDPYTGNAVNYDPSQVGQFYDNPDLMLQQLMGSMGMSPVAGGLRMAEMGDYAKNMRDLAALMIMSGSSAGQSQQDESLLNTAAALMSGGMGAGGRSVDANAALGALFNPNQGGALQRYLIGDPANNAGLGLSEQAGALNPLFQAATSGINPYTQRALASSYQGAINNAQGDLLGGQYGQGENPELFNYLRRNLAGIFPGL